ncbi:MAG: ABC transporter permease subunit [Sarcina sp.]
MNVIKFELKKNIKSVLVWSGVTSAVLILFMSMFPSMKSNDMMEIINGKMDALPSVMLEMFNISEMVDFSNLIDYFAYAFQFILIAVAIYGSILGATMLSEEENSKTIEFLYSKPITRTDIVIKKILVAIISNIIYVTILGIVSFGFIIIFTEVNTNIIDNLMIVKTIVIGAFIVGIVFMAISLAFSTLAKSIKGPIQLGIGIFFGTYILGIVSKLNENIEFLKYFSPYDKFIPADIVTNGLDINYTVVSLFIIAVSIIIAILRYNKKDFRI